MSPSDWSEWGAFVELCVGKGVAVYFWVDPNMEFFVILAPKGHEGRHDLIITATSVRGLIDTCKFKLERHFNKFKEVKPKKSKRNLL